MENVIFRICVRNTSFWNCSGHQIHRYRAIPTSINGSAKTSAFSNLNNVRDFTHLFWQEKSSITVKQSIVFEVWSSLAGLVIWGLATPILRQNTWQMWLIWFDLVKERYLKRLSIFRTLHYSASYEFVASNFQWMCRCWIS